MRRIRRHRRDEQFSFVAWCRRYCCCCCCYRRRHCILHLGIETKCGTAEKQVKKIKKTNISCFCENICTNDFCFLFPFFFRFFLVLSCTSFAMFAFTCRTKTIFLIRFCMLFLFVSFSFICSFIHSISTTFFSALPARSASLLQMKIIIIARCCRSCSQIRFQRYFFLPSFLVILVSHLMLICSSPNAQSTKSY